jgi:hypothetical protein
VRRFSTATRELLRRDASRRPAYDARHRFTRHTPLSRHAWEVVARYRREHPWAGVLAELMENTGEFHVITVADISAA